MTSIKNVVPNPNFDITPNPAAIAQLTPNQELLDELKAAVPAQRSVIDEPSLKLPGMDASQARELADIIDGRAGTYALLARLYRKEVDQSLLDQLCDTRYPVHTGNDDVDHGYRLIATYLSNTWEESLIDLAKDYVSAFIGHTGEHISAAYPFESAYTSEKHLLMQEARDEVLALYRAAGLEKSDSWKEGEDHIALEFEYMQALGQRCATLLQAGDAVSVHGAELLLRAQHNFLEDHLTRWIPAFTHDVEKYAHTDFYRGLAALTRGFIATDQEFTRELFSLAA